MIQVKAKMSAEAERDRELYARRAALAEEGQELARKDRKQLQVQQSCRYTFAVVDSVRRLAASTWQSLVIVLSWVFVFVLPHTRGLASCSGSMFVSALSTRDCFAKLMEVKYTLT